MLDLKAVGTTSGVVAIESVRKPGEGKLMFLDVKEGETLHRNVKCWANKRTLLPLDVGQSGEIEIEVKEAEYPKGSGTMVLEAWVESFGGKPAKVAGKGGGYIPKSPEEIHSQAVAMIVAAAMHVFDGGRMMEEYAERGVRAYVRGLAMASGKPVPPPDSLPIAPKEPEPEPAEGKTGGGRQVSQQRAWWGSIGGDDDMLLELERACKLKGLDLAQTVRDYQAAGFEEAAAVLRDIRPVQRGREEDPSWGLSGEECREGYYRIQRKFGWPLPAQAAAATGTVFHAWAGRRIADFSRMTEADWQAVYRHAYQVEHGAAQPAAFVRWMQEQDKPA
jgi:hypothetical protein